MSEASEDPRASSDIALHLLRQTALSTARSESYRDALQRTLEIVCRDAGWDLGHAWRRIPDTPSQLVSTGIWRTDRDELDDDLRAFQKRTESVRFDLGQGLVGSVWQDAQPRWIDDARELDGFVRDDDDGSLPIRSGCVVPVVVDDKVVSVLEFWARDVVPRDDRLLLAMEAVAAHLASIHERDQAVDPSVFERRRLRSLLTHVEEVFSLVSREGEVLYRNPGWGRVLGYDEAALRTMSLLSIVHPDDLETVKGLHVEAMDRPGVRVGPALIRARTPDGSWREGEVTVINLLEDPTIRATIFNYRDVTEREAAERALADRVRQQEAVADLGRKALRGYGLEALMNEAVDAVARALDVEYAKVLEHVPAEGHLVLRAGVGWRDGLVGEAVVPDEAESQAGYTLQRDPVVVESLAEETRFRAPSLLLDHDVQSGVSVAIEGEGRAFGVLGAHSAKRRAFDENEADFMRTVADVLAQAIQRDRSQRRIRFHSQLLDSVGEAVVACDRDGTIVYWNRAAEEQCGWAREEVLGEPIDLVVPQEDSEEVARLLERVMEEDGWRGELTLERKDGTRYPALVSNVPLRNESGDVVGMVGVSADVTDMRDLERRVRRAERMEAIGRLAGGVAHDFNNILTAIFGYVELASENLGDGEAVEKSLAEIQGAASRAMSLTRQLLAYSRQQVMKPEVIELNTVIGKMDDMVRRLIGEDIEVHVELDPAAGHVRVDPGQLEQVVLNLAVNARDAMPGGGELRVGTRRVELESPYVQQDVTVEPGDYVVLTVSDTGEGMDEETRQHIFDPFFTTRRDSEGTGLGLSTVQGVIEQSGGHVWVYSDPGKGATFRIYLPRVDPVSDEGERSESPPLRKGTETVLVVEDEDAVRRLTRSVLESYGYTVLSASDGETALATAADHEGEIDLLFSDMVMPGMRGSELARRILDRHPETRILLTSGYVGDEPDSPDGSSGVSHPILAKPYTPAGLARRVREILDDE